MNCPKCGASPDTPETYGAQAWKCGSTTESYSGSVPIHTVSDLCKEREAHAETRRKLAETEAACEAAEARCRDVYRWIESHSQDGFMDSKGYTANLDIIFDSLYERYDEARHKIQKLERENAILKTQIDHYHACAYVVEELQAAINAFAAQYSHVKMWHETPLIKRLFELSTTHK